MNNWKYYRRLVQLFIAYKRKKLKLSYMPVRIWVEPTSYCNLKCIMCPNKDLPKEQKGFMEWTLYKKIIDEAAQSIFDIHLLHRGESLLHPDFFKMARYAHEKGLTVKFHTNGTLLNEEKSYQLIESGIDQFSFSFDGYKKETYEKIRVGADFDKTVQNIIQFLEIKKKLKAKKPFTILELINFPEENIRHDRIGRKKFLQNFAGLPLDKLEIKELHNWAGEIPRPRRPKDFSPCTFLWQALIIFWDGSVLPCTQDFFGYLTLGNVKSSSLAEIWNGEKLIRLRQKMINHDIDDLKPCRQCDRPWREKILGVPKEYLWKFISKRMP
ncbi:MAG: radical SAM protein [Candidatus Aminicenantes bacterium]|nr:MAG: radical SAM protein [Candidatus Aminicenantes bacterium]RLE05048.1 MAG: radical SAM protein [Candidatus Aminicenantes bacterium]